MNIEIIPESSNVPSSGGQTKTQKNSIKITSKESPSTRARKTSSRALKSQQSSDDLKVAETEETITKAAKIVNKVKKASDKKVDETNLVLPTPEIKKIEEPIMGKLPFASSIFDESINQLSNTIESLISKNDQVDYLVIEPERHEIEPVKFDLSSNETNVETKSSSETEKSTNEPIQNEQQIDNQAKIKYVVEKMKTKLNNTRKLESEKIAATLEAESVNQAKVKPIKLTRKEKTIFKVEETELKAPLVIPDTVFELNRTSLFELATKIEQPANFDHIERANLIKTNLLVTKCKHRNWLCYIFFLCYFSPRLLRVLIFGVIGKRFKLKI